MLVSLERLEDTWLPIDAMFDQTLTHVCECGIEFVLRKIPFRQPLERPDRQMRIHINQYLADREALKAANKSLPPFQDAGDIEPRASLLRR